MSHTPHRRTIDNHPSGTRYQRFNKRVAMVLTSRVGTMTCFWAFLALSLVSLPSVLKTHNVTLLVAWASSNCIQLVLLPALMVGQNLQSVAADARAAKQFEDTEKILSLLEHKEQT